MAKPRTILFLCNSLHVCLSKFPQSNSQFIFVLYICMTAMLSLLGLLDAAVLHLPGAKVSVPRLKPGLRIPRFRCLAHYSSCRWCLPAKQNMEIFVGGFSWQSHAKIMRPLGQALTYTYKDFLTSTCIPHFYMQSFFLTCTWRLV